MNRTGRIWLLAVMAAAVFNPWATSATAEPRPAASVPAAPRLEADAGTDRVVLEWSRVADAREYRVFRSTNGTWETTPYARVAGRAFRDFRVTNGTSYSYKVLAVNRAGAGPTSNTATARPLAPPDGVVATPGDARATVRWAASAGAAQYVLYRGRGASPDAMSPIATLSVLEHVDTGLTNGVLYYYRVRAKAGTNQSRLSQAARVKPLSAPTPAPTVAPANLVGVFVEGQIKLTWSAVAGATGYKVFRSTTETFVEPPLGTTANLTLTDLNVTPGITYRYKVAAYNASGTGPMSAAISVAPAAPAAPTGVTATAGNAMVTLSWAPVAGATSYKVYRGTATGAQESTPVATGLTTSAFVDSPLTNGTTYFYKVTASGTGGESARSAEASARPIAPLTAPTGVTATPGDTTVTLAWNPVASAVSYSVYRGTSSGGQAPTPIATGMMTPSFMDTALTNGVTYFYQVTAVTASSQSPRSVEVNATPVAAPAVASPTLETFRFLRQATWGPRPGDVAALMPLGAAGREAFIAQQLGAAPSVYPDTLFEQSLEVAQEHFMGLALSGQDQLRQRTAWALHKIWVVSGVEVTSAAGIVTYHRLLLNNAFGNYRDLMLQVTLNPAMGRYLNMLNSRRQVLPTDPLPNENYARELMQLFTLGLVQLNPNGTPVNPSSPLPTYSEDDVKALARILTGWTFGDGNPATIPTGTGSTNYAVPMEAVASRHDTTAKTFLGESFPAGVSAAVELNHALDVIFNQPTLAPFISRQLIQQLVTSNPSPGYVQAVAAVFNDNGGGAKGDMAAIVRAILMHPEALASSDPNTMGGKLTEPVLYITSMMRALSATVTDHPFMTDRSEVMGQRVFYPGSVFSYFSPAFRIRNTDNGTGAPLLGPEFQGLTTVTALERANFVGALLAGHYGTSITVDYSPFTTRATDAAALVDFCADTFMGGRISPQQRTAIINAVNVTAASNAFERARTAIYLTLTGAQAQVDR